MRYARHAALAERRAPYRTRPRRMKWRAPPRQSGRKIREEAPWHRTAQHFRHSRKHHPARNAPYHSRRTLQRSHERLVPRLRAGQPHRAAEGRRLRLPAVRDAQPQTLPHFGGFRGGRPLLPYQQRRLRHRQRLPALPRLPRRRDGRRPHERRRFVARRFGRIPHWLLIQLRKRGSSRAASRCATTRRAAT